METSIFLTITWFIFLTGVHPQSASTRYTIEQIAGDHKMSVVIKDINDRGEVIGSLFGKDARSGAFCWREGQITFLGTLPGFKDSSIWGLNNRGQIVGEASKNAGGRQAFVWENGMMTPLDRFLNSADRAVESPDSVAWAINDSGQIAGRVARSPFTADVPALYTNQGWKLLDMMHPGLVGVPVSLNSNGQMVLVSKESDVGGYHSRLVDGIHLRELTFTKGNDVRAFKINNAGDIVGWLKMKRSNEVRAFLWSKGKWKLLDHLGTAKYSQAHGINDQGEIVGESAGRAFLYRQGKMIDLNTLLPLGSDWVLQTATAINNRGQIVGTGTKGAYLLSPLER